MSLTKLQIAILRNHRTLELKNFRERFVGITKLPFDFRSTLDLETSYNLWNNYESAPSEVPNCSKRLSKEGFHDLLHLVKNQCQPCQIWLFFGQHEYIGGLEFGLHELLDNGLKLLDFDSQIWAYPKNLCLGDKITLDYDDNPLELDGGYELFVWGKWVNQCEHLLERN